MGNFHYPLNEEAREGLRNLHKALQSHVGPATRDRPILAAYALGVNNSDLSTALNYRTETGKPKLGGQPRKTTTTSKTILSIIDALRSDGPASGPKGVYEPHTQTAAYWKTRTDLTDIANALYDDYQMRFMKKYGFSPMKSLLPTRRPWQDIVILTAKLDDTSMGNGGTFDKPNVDVELHFGDVTDDQVIGEFAALSLSTCCLRADYDGGAILPQRPGDYIVFSLESGARDGNSRTTLEFDPQIPAQSPARWKGDTPKDRRLYGGSEETRLCGFSTRPNKLSIVLEAVPTNFRLMRPDTRGEDKNRETELDKVIALLSRIETLGPNATQHTLIELDRRDLIE